MAKVKTTFACQSCGSTYAKWQGKCTACGEWNTIVEEVIEKQEKGEVDWRERQESSSGKPRKLREVEVGESYRIDSGDSELNRVLGGGITPGSLVLMGGEPGIGKSTLLLQLAIKLK